MLQRRFVSREDVQDSIHAKHFNVISGNITRVWDAQNNVNKKKVTRTHAANMTWMNVRNILDVLGDVVEEVDPTRMLYGIFFLNTNIDSRITRKNTFTLCSPANATPRNVYLAPHHPFDEILERAESEYLWHVSAWIEIYELAEAKLLQQHSPITMSRRDSDKVAQVYMQGDYPFLEAPESIFKAQATLSWSPSWINW